MMIYVCGCAEKTTWIISDQVRRRTARRIFLSISSLWWWCYLYRQKRDTVLPKITLFLEWSIQEIQLFLAHLRCCRLLRQVPLKQHEGHRRVDLRVQSHWRSEGHLHPNFFFLRNLHFLDLLWLKSCFGVGHDFSHILLHFSGTQSRSKERCILLQA